MKNTYSFDINRRFSKAIFLALGLASEQANEAFALWSHGQLPEALRLGLVARLGSFVYSRANYFEDLKQKKSKYCFELTKTWLVPKVFAKSRYFNNNKRK